MNTGGVERLLPLQGHYSWRTRVECVLKEERTQHDAWIRIDDAVHLIVRWLPLVALTFC